MEFAGIFSGSDNLFKYLFTAGVVLIIVSLVHPLQKKQDIELQISIYNKEAALLNKKISDTKHIIAVAQNESQKILDSLEHLDRLRNQAIDKSAKDTIGKRIKQIQTRYNSDFNELQKQQREIEISVIILEHERTKINLLKQHALTYDKYFSIFIWLGVVTALIGLVFWAISTRKKESIVSYELQERKGRLTAKNNKNAEEDNH